MSDSVTSITIHYDNKVGECSFTCCDASGNVGTFAAPHDANISERG